jgi:hypothetical protein
MKHSFKLHKKLNKGIALALSITMTLSFCPVRGQIMTASAAGSGSQTEADQSQDVKAPQLNASEVTLYSLDAVNYPEISIPADGNHPSTYEAVSGSTEGLSFKVLTKTEAEALTSDQFILSTDDLSDYNNNAVKVDSSGLLSVGFTRWYWKNGMGSSSPIEGYTSVSTDYKTGTAVVKISSGSDTGYMLVHSKDYADVYLDEVVDGFIKDNITEGMTVEEKVRAINKFVAKYPYDWHYQSARDLVIHGGDCWAYTNAVNYFAKKCGLHAWGRNANKDLGAGSGHRNSLIYDPEQKCYWQCDANAGPGDVIKRTSLISYRVIYGNTSNDKSIKVLRYDGDLTGDPAYPEMADSCVSVREDASGKKKIIFTIPDTLDGYPVTDIDEEFLFNKGNVEKVVLPDTVTNIGTSAFACCTSLNEINIPASLTSIGSYAFCKTGITSFTIPKNLESIGGSAFADSELKELKVSPENTSFALQDDYLLSGDRTKLYFPVKYTGQPIPDTVTSIGEFAFGGNNDITELDLSDNITDIEEGAFKNCGNLKKVHLPASLTSISKGVFYDCAKLKSINIPKTVTSIGDYAFSYDNELDSIVIPASVSSIGSWALYVSKPSVYIESADASLGKNALSSDSTVYCIAGSKLAESLQSAGYNNITALTEEQMQEAVEKAENTSQTETDDENKPGVSPQPGGSTQSGNKNNTLNDNGKGSSDNSSDGIKNDGSGNDDPDYDDDEVVNDSVTTRTGDDGDLIVTDRYGEEYILPRVTVLKARSLRRKTVKVNYSNADDADGYQIQYSRKANFKGAVNLRTDKISKTFKGLSRRKVYYVRVRCYLVVDGKTYYGRWSAKRRVKIR